MKRLLWVGKSRIAGKGLFTAQEIKKGTRILQYIGEKITKAESAKRLAQGNVYVFALNDHWDIDGRMLRNKARYIGKFHVPDNSPLNLCSSPLKVEVQCQPQKRRN